MALVPKYRVLDNKLNDTKQFLIKPIDHCVIGQKPKKTSKITIYINPTLGPTVKDVDTKVGINVCLNNAGG
jgi:hypothetical protein